jgi:hypothetical protein
MTDRRFLAAVSVAQLASGVGGMALAIRRRRAFDLPFWRGRDSAVARDSLLLGTALSAPVVMLGAQACATAALLRQPSATAERVLGGLGAVMVAGYLAERLVRRGGVIRRYRGDGPRGSHGRGRPAFSWHAGKGRLRRSRGPAAIWRDALNWRLR